MKQHGLKWLIVMVMFVSLFGFVNFFDAWAQTDTATQDTVTQYSAQDIVWRINETIDYAASPADGSNLFLSVATDEEGSIYVASYNNILILDGGTGEKIGTLVDESGTIQQYSDIALAPDGTFWIADRRTAVYRVDADGTILATVEFETSPGFDVRSPGQIEVAPDGKLYVNYGGYGIHFQVFTPEGEYIRSIISSAYKLEGVNHFTFALDGTLFFQGAGIGWITEEDDQPTIHEFASEFMAQGEFIQYYGIAIDDEGSVYFSAGADGDSGVSIFQLDSEGTLVGQYGVGQARANWPKDFGADEIGHTASLALTPDGGLIIAHINNTYSQVIRLNVQNEE